MKKKIIVIGIIILAVLIGGFSMLRLKNENMKFGEDDVVIEGIQLGMTQEEIKNILGSPKEIITEGAPFIYGELVDYIYDGMRLSFYDINEGEDLTLGEVYIDSPSVELANGLKVGVTLNDVLTTYYNDGKERSFVEYNIVETILYGDYLWANKNDYKLPEKCEQIAFYNEQNNIISYNYYIPKQDYAEEISLTFYLDENDIVTDISWNKFKIN